MSAAPAGPVTVEDLVGDQHRVWARLRADGPVAFVPVLGGWVVLTHALAAAVMRDAGRFTVDDPRFTTAQVVGPSMLSLDGPAHLRHREAFAAGYRPPEVRSTLGPTIAAETERLLDAVAGRLEREGEVELRSSFAAPLAIAVMRSALGLSVPDRTLLGWYRGIVAGVEQLSLGRPLPGSAAVAVAGLDRAVREAGVRADRELTPAEVTANVAVLLFGGVETAEATTATAIRHVLRSAAPRDPATLAAAVEESMRLEPAAARVDRYATADVELGGAPVRRGDLVMVSLAAANRDPAVFAHPDRFDPGRAEAGRHLTFAVGPHFCLGAPLARLETTVALTALFRRFPRLRLVAERSDPPAGLVFRKPQRVTVTG